MRAAFGLELETAHYHYGNWEGDTVAGGKAQGYFATVVECKTSYVGIVALPDKSAASLNAGIAKYFARCSALPRRTLTVDNGTEFAGHEALAETLNAKIYFAHPYSSWERGLNENTNGLLRQYFPKGSNLRQATPEQVQTATNLLNHRPRKKLNYRTPCEVMTAYIKSRSRGVRIRT